MRSFISIAALALAGIIGAEAAAKNTGLIFIGNEKSSTITVLNQDNEIIKTFDSCARPRGMHFSEDRTEFFLLKNSPSSGL